MPGQGAPLRERKDDIVPLAEHFLRQQSTQAEFSEEAKLLLRHHAWPGNPRELRNVVISGLVNSTGRCIDVEDLGDLGQRKMPPPRVSGGLQLAGLERGAIEAALRKTAGHQQQAADLLGISRRTLSRKLKLYGPDMSKEGTACAY